MPPGHWLSTLLPLLLGLLIRCKPSTQQLQRDISLIENAPQKCLAKLHDPASYGLEECYRHQYTPQCLAVDIPLSHGADLKAIRNCFQCCTNYWLQTILTGDSFNKFAKISLAQQFKMPMIFQGTEFITQMQKIHLQGGIRSALEIHNEHVRPPILLYAESLTQGIRVLTRHYPRKISFVSVFNDSQNSSHSYENELHLKRHRNLVSWFWHSPEPQKLSSYYALGKLQILRGSRFTNVLDFANRSATVQTAAEMEMMRSKRKTFLACFTIKAAEAGESEGDACYTSIRRRVPCSVVQNLPISKEDKRDQKEDYLGTLSQSQYAAVLVNSNPESKKYAGINSPWVAEAILSGAIPVILTHTCNNYQPILRSSKAAAKGEIDYMSRLPVSFVSLGNESDSLFPPSLQLQLQQKETTINLDEHYQKSAMANKPYSISPLFLPYWLQKMLPIRHWESHISRGEKKVKEFTAANSAELQALKFPKATVEVVIPRCCEKISGELSWLQTALRSLTPRSRQVRFTIYYKCPHCLPPSLDLNQFVLRPNQTLGSGGKHAQQKNRHAQQKFFMDPQQLARVRQLLRSAGGIRVLDSFSNTSILNKHLTERIAFDTIYGVNAKEASAYLSHIITRYDTLADVTIFMHTSPALHIHLKAFRNLLRRIDADPTPALASVSPFESVNIRWFGGVWAHDPAKCIMSLMDFCFANSSGAGQAGGTTLGDERRLPPKSRNQQEFLGMPMSGWTAAQFAVKRSAVRLRSLDFWTRLLGANVGQYKLDSCDHRSDEKGTLVASAMERLYHNFFLDGSSQRYPLCLPCDKNDARCLPQDVDYCIGFEK